MSIIQEQEIVIPQEKIVANAIRRINKEGIEALKQSLEESVNLIWHHAECTPQEVLNEFGTDAALLFQASAMVNNLIVTFDPSYSAPPATHRITINPDGTVTVGERLNN